MNGGFSHSPTHSSDFEALVTSSSAIEREAPGIPAPQTALKRRTFDISTDDLRSANERDGNKRPRRRDNENSVYAIQKEALLRELRTSSLARKNLEEQILNLKTELKAKSLELKRPSAQLEKQLFDVLAERDSLSDALSVSEREQEEKLQLLEEVSIALNNSKTQIQNLEQELLILAENYAQSNQEAENLSRENFSLRKLLEQDEHKLSVLGNELSEYKETYTHQVETIECLTAQNDAMHLQQTEIDSVKYQLLSEIEDAVNYVLSTKDALEAKLETQERELRSQLSSVQAKNSKELEVLNKCLRNAELKVHDEIHLAMQASYDMESQLEKSQSELKAVRSSHKLICSENETLRQRYSEQQRLSSVRIEDIKAKLVAIYPKCQDVKDRNGCLDATIIELRNEFEEKRRQVISLENIKGNHKEKLAEQSEKIGLYDSENLELKIALKREKERGEKLGGELEQLKDLKCSLDDTIKRSANKHEQEKVELHKLIKVLEVQLEKSQLDLKNLKCDSESIEREFYKQSLESKEMTKATEMARASPLQADLERQKELLAHERKKVRLLQNQVQDLKGNIRVIARIRPSLKNGSSLANMSLISDRITLTEVEAGARGNNRKKVFSVGFDRIFGPSASNKMLCEEAEYLIQCALDGRNVCILAYGQTGSGKTHTMGGADGVTSYAIRKLMEARACSKQLSVFLESVEIYNEQVIDLLADPSEVSEAAATHSKNIAIQLNARTGQPELVGTKRFVADTTEAAQEVLEKAMKQRSTAATHANSRSSRSHFVFTAKLITPMTESTLHLVDLAGSERLAEARTAGERLKETQAINTSLSSLGNVINALLNKRSSAHIPYRSSKLTYLLQSSLSGGAKTMLLTTLSPEVTSLEETKSTLRFAEKATRAVLK